MNRTTFAAFLLACAVVGLTIGCAAVVAMGHVAVGIATIIG